MIIDVFGLFKVNVLYILIALMIFILILIVLTAMSYIKISRLNKKYKVFMQDCDGISIEKLIKNKLDDVEYIKSTLKEHRTALKDIYEKMEYTFQKVGVVTYDAFQEMGGKLSFAICMLDKKNNGYVVNVMHSNNGCFAYVKEIIDGKSFLELGTEEEKALSQAIAGKMGDSDLSREINDKINKNKL